MIGRDSLVFACALISSLFPGGLSAGEPDGGRRRPNVVVILADDLGYHDLGCQGSRDISTPHIDDLARRGVRCTNAYASAPVCSPTRAGLLTGRYQQRFGHEFNPGQALGPTADLGLPRSEITLADLLKRAGYATGLVGKWHLGRAPGLRPKQRGFDEFFGFLEGAHPYVYAGDVPGGSGGVVAYRRAILRGDEPVDERQYLTDAFTREALAFIDRHRQGPFFLYLAYNAVHSPLEAVDAYRGRFEGLGDSKRRTYAAMVAALDDGVGAVLAKLREAGLEEDTLVVFLSDNGGAPRPHTASDNAPLSGKKADLLEGGIRVPFLVRWTGTLPAGTVYDPPVSSLDVLPTALAVAGGRPPGDRDIDGVDLIPYLTGRDARAPHESLFWRYGENLAVRKGTWKLHKMGARTAQLYDLSADVGETTDLAPARPDVVKDLAAALAGWEARMKPPLWGNEGVTLRALDWLYEMTADPRLRDVEAPAAVPKD